MRGEQHALIGILSGSLALAPWISTLPPELVLIAFGGIFLGSLAPDADSPDAAIMHGLRSRRGYFRRLKRHTAPILPLIGTFIRYFIYVPLSAILLVASIGRVRPHHRGVLHSLPGISLTTATLIAYIWLTASVFGDPDPLPVAVFGAAFFAGCFLHLLADSTTRGGIAWMLPFSRRKLRGRVAPGSRLEKRPELLGAVLGASTFLCLIAEPLLAIPGTTAKMVSGMLAGGIWALFLALSGVRIH
ncbi:MAG: metal-dependent hydrolase [Methanomicrobiaceae archaeon]|nr:metal-dependent hydrolase [Methanomicrobiaceae archaeon]